MGQTTNSGSANLEVTPKLIYTFPSNIIAATGVSALTSNDNIVTSRKAKIFRRRTGSLDSALSALTAVPQNTSVNLMAGKPTFIANDQIWGYVDAVTSSFGDTVAIALTTGSTPVALCSNGAGVLIYATTIGIWYSTNDGNTWTKSASNVLSSLQTAAGEKPCAYINNTFFIYISATSALKSTDQGVTWTLDSGVTNAPQLLCTSLGSVVKNGSTYAGLDGATGKLTTTTLGITWVLGTNAPASGTSSNYLAWDGTEYVTGSVGSGTTSYHSTNGNSWTSSGAMTGINGNPVPRGMLSNGAGVLIAVSANGSSTWSRSTDHGATWASINVTAGLNLGGSSLFVAAFFTGQVFFAAVNNQPGSISNSNLGESGNWYVDGENSGGLQQCCQFCAITLSGRVITIQAPGANFASINRSQDLLMTPVYGIHIDFSTSELT